MTHPNPPPSKSTYEEARDVEAKAFSKRIRSSFGDDLLPADDAFKVGFDFARDYFASQLREKDDLIQRKQDWIDNLVNRENERDAMIEKLEFVIKDCDYKECLPSHDAILKELKEWRKGQ